MSTLVSRLHCWCNAVNEPASLLASSTLPIESEFCHCNPCRQTTGVLGGTFVDLVGAPSNASLDACTRYLRTGGTIARYFCATCGTRTFEHNTLQQKWYAQAGIVEPDPPRAQVVKVTSHAFVADTGDGGLAFPLRRLGGRTVPFYAEAVGRGEMRDEDLEALAAAANSKTVKSEVLEASCHCGSVQFSIKPPSLQGRPDLERWLRKGGTKYCGLFCFCDYCRLESGQCLSVNTYVMPENIVVHDKSPFDYTSQDEEAKVKSASLLEALPGLRVHHSSETVRRSFCGTCGASVFFERQSRPQVVIVAVGILRAKSGCIATEWVEWDGDIYYKEEATDSEMANALEAWSSENRKPEAAV